MHTMRWKNGKTFMIQPDGYNEMDTVKVLGNNAIVLVRIAQNDAQLHNLHIEQQKYEQCLILLVIMHNCAMHDTHLMHNIVLLCTCA